LGNEEELNLGIAAMLAPMPEREENTPQKLGLGLPSVKEVPEEEGKEETEESLPKGEHSTETRTWTTFS
jgi:hypothetical protein